MEEIKPSPKPIRIFFFWSGMIATVAYRIIIILNFYSPLWVKISWYIGTIGFIFYFWHRYKIEKKRAKLVFDYKLIEAVGQTQFSNEKQKEAMRYIIETTFTSKARWNSFLIFLLSVLALIVGIVLDLVLVH